MVARRSLFRRARFTSPPCSLLSYCVHGRRGAFGAFWSLQHRFAWQVHRTLFHSRGRCGTSRALLKRGQARVKTRGAFGGNFARQVQYSVTLDDVLKGSKIVLCDRRIWFATRWWFRAACRRRTSDPSGSFFVAGQYFVELENKAAET